MDMVRMYSSSLVVQCSCQNTLNTISHVIEQFYTHTHTHITHACMHTHTLHTHTNIHIHTLTHIHTYMYTYMYTQYTHTHTHVHTHTYISYTVQPQRLPYLFISAGSPFTLAASNFFFHTCSTYQVCTSTCMTQHIHL